MSILYGFNEPKDMLYKLLREGVKCHSTDEKQSMFDSLFNFVVTGHVIRDWCIDYLNINQTDFHEHCNTYDWLKYCRDIANTSKHFSLSWGISTVSSVDFDKTEYVNVDANFNKIEGLEENRNTAMIILPNGEEEHLLMFLHGVLSSYKKVFDHYNIPYDKEKLNLAYLALV